MNAQPNTPTAPRLDHDRRESLHEIPLTEWVERACESKVVVATMALDQWDSFLSTVYDSGGILLEVNDDEQLIRAYQQDTPTQEEQV